jgi:DNA mismatch endonuclease (patch repair protein)
MGDVFSPQKRSEIMSAIRGTGNRSTEQKLASLFRSHRITGWRRRAAIFGKPDFVFPKAKVAVFVDGCFWHGCHLHGSTPSSNREFWSEKLRRNRERDNLVGRQLKRSGWRVVRIWQHELKEPGRVILRVRKALPYIAGADRVRR